MNIHKGLLLFSTSLLLVACGNSNNEASLEAEEDTSSAQVQEDEEPEVDENEVDGPLENVGEYNTSNGAKSTLIEIQRPEEDVELYDSISLEFVDIKIIEIDEIEEDYKEDYKLMDVRDGDHIIQIVYNIINDTDKLVEEISFPTVVTSTGEQLDETNVLTLGSYEVQSNAKAKAGFQNKIEDIDIDGLRLIFDLYDEDFEPLGEKPKTIEVEF